MFPLTNISPISITAQNLATTILVSAFMRSTFLDSTFKGRPCSICLSVSSLYPSAWCLPVHVFANGKISFFCCCNEHESADISLRFYFISFVYLPEEGLLEHRVDFFSIFWGTSKLFSLWLPIYFPPTVTRALFFLHLHQQTIQKENYKNNSIQNSK